MSAGAAPRPGLIGLLVRHLVAGAVGAVVFLAAMLLTDYAGIASMAAASSEGWLYIALLFFGLLLTFGGVAMAVGIMRERD